MIQTKLLGAWTLGGGTHNWGERGEKACLSVAEVIGGEPQDVDAHTGR